MGGGDFDKVLALSAGAIAIGLAVMMVLSCNKDIPGVTSYEGLIPGV